MDERWSTGESTSMGAGPERAQDLDLERVPARSDCIDLWTRSRASLTELRVSLRGVPGLIELLERE
eukprot:11970981-Alexandrium_andersonii.AAC.1